MTSFSELTGVLDRTQFPDALLTDGSRPLTGNLAVSPGITIDSVDISAFQSQYQGHLGNPTAHSYVRNLLDDSYAAAPRNVLTNDSRIYGAGGITVTATADGLRIGGTGAGGGMTGLKATDLTGIYPDSNGWIQVHGSSGISAVAATNRINLTVVPSQIAHNNLGSIGKSDHHIAFIGLTVGAVNVAPSASDRITLTSANNRLALAGSGSTVTFTLTETNIVHQNLSGAGTNTHTQIDSHIAAASAVHGISGSVVGTTDTQTLTNKTLTTPTIASFVNATHNHSNAAGGGTIDHGALTGRDDDDHTIYLLATGARTGATSQIQAFTNGVRTSTIDTASGNLTLSPAGDIVLNPTGKEVLPNLGYDTHLGSLQKKYLTLHAAELWVETLVAQETIATIGGRILVGPTTTLISDALAAATTIDVKHQLTNGDRIYLEANGKVEFMAVTNAGTAITGGFRHTVTRNLDASGANDWYAGDAVFNTGQAGSGFIDLYSVRGVKSASQAGPTIVGNVRNSSTYNDWTEHWAIGNLNGLYGYGTDTYGAALGKYASGQPWIGVDATNGFRIMRHTTQMARWDTSGNIVVGEIANGKSRVEIGTTNGVRLISRSGGVDTVAISLSHAGSASFTGQVTITSGSSGYANMSDKPTNLSAINSSEGTKLTGIAAGATVGATWGTNLSSIPTRFGDAPGSAGLYLTATHMGYYNGSAWKAWIASDGNFYFGGSSGAHLEWNGSKLRGIGTDGTTEQWYASSTDGKLYAGAGNVMLDSTGVRITLPATTWSSQNAFRLTDTGGVELGGVYGYTTSTTSHTIGLRAIGTSARRPGAYIQAEGTGSGVPGAGLVYIAATNAVGGKTANITLDAGTPTSTVVIGGADSISLVSANNIVWNVLRPPTDLGTNLGSASFRFGTLYVDQVIATSVSGSTMSGAEWEYTGNMVIDANSASNTTVSITNQGAGQADLDVQRNIIVGGTVDGVDIALHHSSTAAHGATGAVVGTTNTQTLSNKTLTTPTIGSFTNAQHNHADAAGGGTLSYANLTSRSHTLVGADHTASGLTVGHVIRASGATTFAWAQLAHGDLSGIGTNTHSQIDTHIAATGVSVHGLGTISTQAANNVSITGGSITGITDLAVADGGTGASTAVAARTNLGLVIGTHVQAWSTHLDSIAALAITDSNIIVGNGTTWVAESGNTARTSLGLGTGDSPAFTALTVGLYAKIFIETGLVAGEDTVIRNDNGTHRQEIRILDAAGQNISGFMVRNSGDGGANWTEVFRVTGGAITHGANTVWTSGNDGASSGLDADLLDGQQGSYYQNASNINAGTLAEARLPYRMNQDVRSTDSPAFAMLTLTRAATNNTNTARIVLVDTSNNQNIEIVHDPYDSTLPVASGYGVRIQKTTDNPQGYAAILVVEGQIFANNNQDVQNATYINAGTLADARLSINVPLKNGTNTFSAGNTFSSTVNLSALTASRLLATDGSKNIVSVAALTSWVAGTTNRITVTDDGDGTITLNAPQDLHTAATPMFAGLISSWVRPASDSTTGVQIRNAAGTAIVNVDTTNQRVGIGTTSPLAGYKLHVNGDSLLDGHIETDSIDVNGSLNVYAGDLRVFKSGDFTTPVIYVDESARSVGFNRDPDIQFSVDVAGALRAEWLVGPHAIQLSDAMAIMHFDGPGPYTTNFTGTSQTHKGKVGTATGGVIYRPGKFGKAVQVAEATANLITNPSFETGTSGWTLVDVGSDGSIVHAQSSEQALYGLYSLKLTQTTSGLNEYVHFRITSPAASTTYTASAWVNVTSFTAGAQGNRGILFYDSADGGNLQIATITGVTNGWVRLSVTLTTTATPGNVELRLYAPQGTVYWDGVQIEQKAYATSYCDGSLGIGHSWSGTAHASTSSRTKAYLTYPLQEIAKPESGTIMCWIKPEGLTGDANQFVVGATTTGANLGIRIGAGGNYRIYLGNLSSTDTGIAATPGVWQHVTLTWNNGSYAFYKDGVAPFTGSYTPMTSLSSAFYVGGLTISATYRFNGLVDDLVILSRAASADEIRAIYESNAPVFAESATAFFKSYGPTPVEINEEGLWVEGPTVGAIFGIYGASATKSWGGVTLSEGDVLLGRSPAYMLWDDSETKLKIGNVSNEHIAFDGSTIAFMNGVTTLGSLDSTTWTLGSTATEHVSITSTAIQFKDGASTVYTELVGGKLTLGQAANSKSRVEIDDTNGIRLISRSAGGADTTAISLTHAGAASFSGSVTATAGAIGGWAIGASTLSSNNLVLDNAGSITVGTSNSVLKIESTDPESRLWAGHASYASAPFRVSAQGSLYAALGTVGGWTLGSTSLTSGSGANTVGLDSGGTNPVIYAGSATPGSAPFRVTKAGHLTATSGLIGGWTVGANSISASNIVLDSSGYLSVGTSNAIFRVEASSPEYLFWAGHASFASAPLRMTPQGALHMTGPTLDMFSIIERASTPSSPASGAAANIYVKGDKLVIQFNDGGTVRYKYLDLTSTGVTWVHSTTAP